MMMQLSKKGLELLKKAEGFSPKFYRDTQKGWSIGYGCFYTNDEYAKLPPNKVVNEAEATTMLLNKLHYFETRVNSLVKVPLTQCQFDALVLLTYNIGVGNFSASTLLTRLNAGNYTTAAEQFLVWRKADGKVNEGLVSRRATEKELFEGRL